MSCCWWHLITPFTNYSVHGNNGLQGWRLLTFGCNFKWHFILWNVFHVWSLSCIQPHAPCKRSIEEAWAWKHFHRWGAFLGLFIFLVWFHGTLDRLKSSLVKEWYNNIVARDESPLISRSLSNPLFIWTFQALRVYRAQPMWRPSSDITVMHYGQMEKRGGENFPQKTSAAEAGVQHVVLLFTQQNWLEGGVQPSGLAYKAGAQWLYGYFRLRKP